MIKAIFTALFIVGFFGLMSLVGTLISKYQKAKREKLTSLNCLKASNSEIQLKKCLFCKEMISERAIKCPKCGEECKQYSVCNICNSQIPESSSTCPECGDPSPFKISLENNI